MAGWPRHNEYANKTKNDELDYIRNEAVIMMGHDTVLSGLTKNKNTSDFHHQRQLFIVLTTEKRIIYTQLNAEYECLEYVISGQVSNRNCPVQDKKRWFYEGYKCILIYILREMMEMAVQKGSMLYKWLRRRYFYPK